MRFVQIGMRRIQQSRILCLNLRGKHAVSPKFGQEKRALSVGKG